MHTTPELDRTARYLRRRVPARLVDDLAQTTALEAWVHRERRAGAGFVIGIARHEAIDALRREQRERARRAECDVEAERDERPVADAHAQLGEIFDFVSEQPALAAPFRWILEEHAGHTFEEIAAREGLKPAAVRQRVSRLRRALAVAFACALLAIVGIGAWRGEAPPRSFSAAAPSTLDGVYVVVDVRSQDPRAWLLRDARIVVEHDQIVITAHGKTSTYSMARTSSGVIVDVGGEPEALDVASSPSGTLELTSPLGSIRLEKAR